MSAAGNAGTNGDPTGGAALSSISPTSIGFGSTRNKSNGDPSFGVQRMRMPVDPFSLSRRSP